MSRCLNSAFSIVSVIYHFRLLLSINCDIEVSMGLQVALARAGVGSRRKCALIIKSGRVKIKGKIIAQPGFAVGPADELYLDGKIIECPTRIYLLLNKPAGVTTTLKDKFARHTVAEFFPEGAKGIYPAGRLDRDACGLLLLTNDGELSYRLTHPKFKLVKKYLLLVKGAVAEHQRIKLEKGVYLEGRKTMPCKIRVIKSDKRHSRLLVELKEGRKRQLKKMFKQIGCRVIYIERLAIGPLNLGRLKEGRVRPLTRPEILRLKQSVGL